MGRLGQGKISRELTVGEVARRSGVAVSTIHFYESQGLIAGWRNKGNHRRYAREVLRRVALVKVAQRTGISLASIRTALSTLPKGRTPTADDWKKLSATWRADLNDRINRLMGSSTETGPPSITLFGPPPGESAPCPGPQRSPAAPVGRRVYDVA